MLQQRHGRRSKAENYYLSIEVAATKLKVGLTTLKKLCRKFNIKRWPYRKVQQTQRLAALTALLELLSDLDVPAESKLWSNLGPAEEAVIVKILQNTDWTRVKGVMRSGGSQGSGSRSNTEASPTAQGTPKAVHGDRMDATRAAMIACGLATASSSSALPAHQGRVQGWLQEQAQRGAPLGRAVPRPEAWGVAPARHLRHDSLPSMHTGMGIHHPVQAPPLTGASDDLRSILERLKANHAPMQHAAAAAHNMSPRAYARALSEVETPLHNPFAAPHHDAMVSAMAAAQVTPFMTGMQGPAQPRLASIEEAMRAAPPQAPPRETSSVQLAPPNPQALASVNPFLQRSSIDSLRTPTKRPSLTDSLGAGSLSHRDSLDLLTRLSSGLHSAQSLSALMAPVTQEGSAAPPKVHESDGSGTTTRWSVPPAAAAAAASMMHTASSLLAGPLGSELLFPGGKDAVPMLPGDSGLLSLASLGPLNSLKLGEGPLIQQLDPSLLQDLAPWALAGTGQQQQPKPTQQDSSAAAAAEPPGSKADTIDMQQLLQLAASLSQHPLP